MYIFIPFANNNEKNTINGKLFISFLEMCVSRSDSFSLNITPGYWGKYTRLSRALKPYHIATIDTQKWFGYNYNNIPHEELRIYMHQNIYKSTPEVIAIIRKSIKEIFFNRELNPFANIPTQDVDDICFFKDGKMIMGSISHERMLYMDSEVFPLDILSQYGRWKYENTFFPEIPEIKSLII